LPVFESEFDPSGYRVELFRIVGIGCHVDLCLNTPKVVCRDCKHKTIVCVKLFNIIPTKLWGYYLLPVELSSGVLQCIYIRVHGFVF